MKQCTNCKGKGTEPFLDDTEFCRKCKGLGYICNSKHWKKIGKRTYNCPECKEVLTLGL